MSEQQRPVWLITGCSTGFGRELAKRVLELGWVAVITARKPEQVEDLIQGYEDRALALALDVTDKRQGADVVRQAEATVRRPETRDWTLGFRAWKSRRSASTCRLPSSPSN